MRIIPTCVIVVLLAASDVLADVPNTIQSSYSNSVSYNVTCSPKGMIVTVKVNSSTARVYLQRLKDYKACEPETSEGDFIFRLPFDDIYRCGTTRMLNKITGVRIYYHRVVVEEESEKDVQVILVTCSIPPTHNASIPQPLARSRRDTFPANFVEPEHINITEYIQASAPVPYLGIAVRQQGHMLDTTKGVQPGTPLHMIVYLDKKSAETYGLMTSFLKVTDGSADQEEVIIMNGCSIDPYIFGNFESSEGGDTLSAKFRAFKFPDANHVLFVGTVSVCLQKCRGVPCGNGQYGFGRRKRRTVPTDLPPDPNKLFEVEMTTVLKVQYPEEHFTLNKGSLAGDWSPQKEDNQTISVVNEVSPASLHWTIDSGAPSWRTSTLLLVLLLLQVVLLR